MWPDQRILDLLHLEVPLLQAPMAGSTDSAMVIAVSEAGGLGALPCAMLATERAVAEVATIRAHTDRPFNLNFFCHSPPPPDPLREEAWRRKLSPYYEELGLDSGASMASPGRAPFDAAACEWVSERKVPVVSFHFGLPEPSLLRRVKDSGAKILSSATSVAEARWLEERGCDAIIAQGAEAGGHRGSFLPHPGGIGGGDHQVGTMALVPQIVDAVSVPVIAAGGIADARGIVAALALGASAVQLGTAYLFCPEAKIHPLYRQALREAQSNDTVLTNLFSGGLARGIINRLIREAGPVSSFAPPFPLAGGALAGLRTRAEQNHSPAFSPLWSGQAAPLAQSLPARDLTQHLAHEALRRLSSLAETGSARRAARAAPARE